MNQLYLRRAAIFSFTEDEHTIATYLKILLIWGFFGPDIHRRALIRDEKFGEVFLNCHLIKL
jgi:hypothetical protein